jgi:hypothetical protein
MTEARPAARSPSKNVRIGAALFVVIPYALVALGLRFVMARVFFLSGQAKIEGPRMSIDLSIIDFNLIDLNLRQLGDFSIILPAEIKPSTFRLFETEYAGLPMTPAVATYLFT